MLYGAAYYPEHRDPEKWEYDLDRMAEMSVNALRILEFAWIRLEPKQGEYDFEWVDDFAAKALDRGIRLLMCPPMRTAPSWLVDAHPDVGIVREDGVRLEYGSRYSFCINHPALREHGLALAAEMGRHYADHDAVLGWHLDNEYGDEPDCHCPLCRSLFQEWCREHHADIDDLNRRWGLVFWGLEFSSFEQIPTPRATKATHNPGHVQAWRNFRSDCTIGLVGLHAAALRDNGVETFVTTNNQMFWNFRTDYYAMARYLDVCGTNFYPPYSDDCRNTIAAGLAAVRSYGDQRNFQIHELRNRGHDIPGRGGNVPAPGAVERLTLQTVAHGADATFYFRWRALPFGNEQNHGTITDYDGRPTRIHRELVPVGEKLRRVGPLLEGTSVRSEVGVFHDFQSRWMTESLQGFYAPKDLFLRRVQLLHGAAHGLGVNCDYVGRTQYLDDYRVLIAGLLQPVDDRLVDRLVAWVEQGGTLIWHPQCGMKDMNANIHPDRIHPKLAELFGVDVREREAFGPDETAPFEWRGDEYVGHLAVDLPVLRDAEALGGFTSHFFAGTAAVTERRVGAGRAVYVMTFAGEEFHAPFLDAIFDEAGVTRLLPEPPPPTVDVSERSSPDGRRFLFLCNCGSREERLRLTETCQDVWNEETVAGETTLPPQGVRILRRPE